MGSLKSSADFQKNGNVVVNFGESIWGNSFTFCDLRGTENETCARTQIV